MTPKIFFVIPLYTSSPKIYVRLISRTVTMATPLNDGNCVVSPYSTIYFYFISVINQNGATFCNIYQYWYYENTSWKDSDTNCVNTDMITTMNICPKELFGLLIVIDVAICNKQKCLMKLADIFLMFPWCFLQVSIETEMECKQAEIIYGFIARKQCCKNVCRKLLDVPLKPRLNIKPDYWLHWYYSCKTDTSI